jgi:hypothetical protein
MPGDGAVLMHAQISLSAPCDPTCTITYASDRFASLCVYVWYTPLLRKVVVQLNGLQRAAVAMRARLMHAPDVVVVHMNSWRPSQILHLEAVCAPRSVLAHMKKRFGTCGGRSSVGWGSQAPALLTAGKNVDLLVLWRLEQRP